MSNKMERALQTAAASSRMEGCKVTAYHVETAKKILNGSLTMAEYLAALKVKSENH